MSLQFKDMPLRYSKKWLASKQTCIGCVSQDQLFKFDMEPMEDENCSQQFEEVYNLNRSSEDWLFDQIITQLQEIVIDPAFETSLADYMRSHWGIFDSQCSQQQLQGVFQEYKTQMCTFLQNNIRRKVPEFEWKLFQELLRTRRHMIEEQIMDTLQSLDSSESFKDFIADYRSAHEEEQRLRVLTIKSNKVSQNKTVKGRDNIFASGENLKQNQNLLSKGTKPVQSKKREPKDKSEDQLLVPELILTVKSMRKC